MVWRKAIGCLGLCESISPASLNSQLAQSPRVVRQAGIDRMRTCPFTAQPSACGSRQTRCGPAYCRLLGYLPGTGVRLFFLLALSTLGVCGAERWSPAAMDCRSYGGRCFGFFLLALLLDAVGLILFLMGIFMPLSFWDFFIFTGPLIIFLSLLCWIIWYLGNITLPYKELTSC